MPQKTLYPDQILTLADYPVHNEHILKMYHRMFRHGHAKLVPPLPVVSIARGELTMPGHGPKVEKYNERLARFLKRHPAVKYCLVDGTHKTTAAALCAKRLRVIVFTKDADIKTARKMVEKGELFSLTTGDTNKLTAALAILRKHFFKFMLFETVAEKTRRMVKDKILPKYMIRGYKRK